jgi:hypothetical protein
LIQAAVIFLTWPMIAPIIGQTAGEPVKSVVSGERDKRCLVNPATLYEIFRERRNVRTGPD